MDVEILVTEVVRGANMVLVDRLLLALRVYLDAFSDTLDFFRGQIRVSPR